MITTVSFIALLVNWYNNRLLPLIRQFFFIPNRIINIIPRTLRIAYDEYEYAESPK
jgi:hypothetical protein